MLESGKNLSEIRAVTATSMKEAIEKAQAGKGKKLTVQELRKWTGENAIIKEHIYGEENKK